MMKQYFVLLCFVLVCCYACKRTAVNDFLITERIVAYDSLYSDANEPFNSVTGIAVVDSIVITKHARDEFNFSFIDIHEGKMIRRWGKKGRGPEEYVNMSSDFAVSDSNLIFLDAARKEINYVSIPDLLMKRDSVRIKKEAYPYTVDFRPRYFTMLHEQKIAVGSFREGYFGVLDSMNHIIPNTFDYPFAYEGIEGIYRGSVYQTKVASNDSLDRFVIQTLASDIFEIYQMTEKGINRLFVNAFNEIPLVQKNGSQYGLKVRECIVGLTEMSVTDEFIYFGYSPEIYADAMKTGVGVNEILCFDWNGNKVKKYILPFAVNTFCVYENDFYTVRYFADASHILRFKL